MNQQSNPPPRQAPRTVHAEPAPKQNLPPVTKQAEIAVTQPPKPGQGDGSVFGAMAAQYGMSKQGFTDALMSVVMKSVKQFRPTLEQVAGCLVVAKEYGLNPFTKQIHFFPDKNNNLVPVVGIDGWAYIVNEHPMFNGVEFAQGSDEYDGGAKDEWVEAHVYRKDRDRPTVVREYLSENRRNTEPWKAMPRRMLRHRAYIQGMRLAFGLSLMDEEDYGRMMDVERERATAKLEADPRKREKPQGPRAMTAALAARNSAPDEPREVEAEFVAADVIDELPDYSREAEPAATEPEHTTEPPKDINVCGLYIPDFVFDSYEAWCDELVTTSVDKKRNPLVGHSWRNVVEQGGTDGGRYAVLKKTVAGAVDRQANGDYPSDYECRAAVCVCLMDQRARDSAPLPSGALFDGSDTEDPG